MEKIKNNSHSIDTARLLGAMGFLIILFFMVCPVAPLRWADLYSSYGKTAIIAMAAIYFYAYRFKGTVEVKLVFIYTAWLFATRLMNTDIYLQNEYDLVLSRILCCVVFPIGFILKGKERERLLDAMIAVAGAFYFVTALLSLYACILGVFFYVPPEGVVIGKDDGFFTTAFNYIVAWNTNRTISALWFYIGWSMMIYEFFHCQKKLWRIPIVLAWLVFSFAIAFCYCRSVIIVSAISTAMLFVLLGMKYIHIKSNKLKVIIIAAAALAALLVTYKGSDAITVMTGKVYNSLDVEIERTSDQFLSSGHEDGNSFGETREVKKSASTGSGRFPIYRSIFTVLKDDPSQLFIGKLSSKVMIGVNNYLRTAPDYVFVCDIFHMHNYLLQTLMLTGMIGFLTVLAFSVLLAVRMIRLFFSKAPEATLAIKALVIPVSGIMFYGMFETVIFTNCADQRAPTDFRELFFFMISGIALAYSYDLFPQKKKGKK